MTTQHEYVEQYVRNGLMREATDLEKMCEIAIMDQVFGITAREARRAVLAVGGAASWHKHYV